MPQRQWGAKQERQYEKIKQSQLEEGRSEERATEIAARTVNKERARSGVADAKREGIRGRSRMTKAQLERALG